MRVFICAVTLVLVLTIVVIACCTLIGVIPVLIFADAIDDALKKLTKGSRVLTKKLSRKCPH